MGDLDPMYQKYLDGTCKPPESFGSTAQVAEVQEKPKQLELGLLLHIPRKATAKTMGLEMNVGCEFPVCASNPFEVRREQISVVSDDGKRWTLDRPAKGSFATPGQYRYWLWFLDRCQNAADYMRKNGIDTTLPSRITLRPTEIMPVFDITKFGRAYKDIDEAFKRYSKTVVSASTAFVRRGRECQSEQIFGTLCTYESFYEGSDYQGWVAPNQMIWNSIVAGYVKTVPFSEIMRLNSYVAQRLLIHLARRNVGLYKVALGKLLPKIPMGFSRPHLAKSTLEEHHAELCDIGFLDRMPDFIGRGKNLQVVYSLS